MNIFTTIGQWTKRGTLPLSIVFLLLTLGGIALLERAEHQARDTIRKHHLEDLEHSLYFAQRQHGTYPPYDQSSWCGVLSLNTDSPTHQQIEAALRTQHEKYANPAKPFPRDPKFTNTTQDYFYWKRSPSHFELFATLEAEPTGERHTAHCLTTSELTYFDYGISSIYREENALKEFIITPL